MSHARHSSQKAFFQVKWYFLSCISKTFEKVGIAIDRLRRYYVKSNNNIKGSFRQIFGKMEEDSDSDIEYIEEKVLLQ